MFDKNVIFMDGEFTDLSAQGTKFVSIALIKPNNRYYYAINSDYDSASVSDWVRENVLIPLYKQTISGDQRNHLSALNFHKVIGKTEKQIAEEIRQFVGDSRPYLVADVNQFDWMGICGLFGVWGTPFFYIPIDFASILWAKGIAPDIRREDLAWDLGIDVSCFKKHNALDDARVLKALYERIA